jgi:uncharacterized coiled-coil protein SlyX
MKSISLALAVVIVLLAGATTALFMKYRTTNAQYVETKASEETARNRYAETINAIAEIQDSLNAIAVGDTSVQMRTGSLQTEQRLSGPNQQEALDRIAVLRASISRNKERIRQLESSLHSSGIKVTGLEKMVRNLKQTVTEKETMVAQLAVQVDSLTTQVNTLATTVQETQDTLHVRDQTLEDRRRELATVYVAMGTKKQLRDSGVLTAKGGVLGMGKTLKPTGEIHDDFTAVDTDQQTDLPIDAKKAQVVTPQPPNSYELRQQADGKMELHIIDPKEFRKVRSLVIVTA